MSNFTFMIIALSFFYLFLVTCIFYQCFIIKNLKQKYADLEKKSGAAQSQSQELTEFLMDVKNHGYSFTRVNPDSVLVRSPKNI